MLFLGCITEVGCYKGRTQKLELDPAKKVEDKEKTKGRLGN